MNAKEQRRQNTCLTQTGDSVNEINELLFNLGFKRNYCSSVQTDNFNNVFSELIYKFRNSIVHNKETEFHITYGNFSEFPAIVNLMENLLIKCLEEIVYNLLINNNPLVWYSQPSLQLYNNS